ncbi:MAG: four helix bundle protein [Ekhidna sp.]|nr:four helix bundle protein [Ekhidna sp.]
MEKTKTFTELIMWQKAHDFVLDIYKVSQPFPKEETYGLTSQIRRASVSIPANIAEGYKRRSQADKARFFNISEGSLDEVKYYLILAKDLGFVSDTESLLSQTDEIAKLLYSYKKAILNTKF